LNQVAESAVFLCPSDYDHEGAGRTSYAGNGGYGKQKYGFNGVIGYSDKYIGHQGLRDGSSNTAAMSEWVVGRFQVRDPLGIVFKTEDLTEPDEFDEFVAACHGADLAAFSLWGKAARWLLGSSFPETPHFGRTLVVS
jgi:hypothetical protein